MELHPIPIELQFVEPNVAGRGRRSELGHGERDEQARDTSTRYGARTLAPKRQRAARLEAVTMINIAAVRALEALGYAYSGGKWLVPAAIAGASRR